MSVGGCWWGSLDVKDIFDAPWEFETGVAGGV